LTYTPNVKIELGGLEEIKDWVRIRQGAAVSEVVRKRFLLPPPRGVMLCGASGGGKSQLAKLIAMEFNLALLRLDVGSLFGSYVGQSEQYTREALEMAEVLAPVVLWIDEIDKAFKGMGSGGDNGVSARVFGYFLTWLSEKQDSVFVVVTANDFEDLLDRFPEFGRKGRFDQIFWVNLPSTESLSRIFSIYLQQSYEEGLLAVDDASVDALQIQTANEPRKVGGAFDRLCDVLSHPDLAEGLTGAEVEYAVTEAKYEIYSDTERLGGEHRLTPGLLTKVVGKAARGALYRPGTEDRLKLERLRGKAEANGWPIVS
jgi:SpoVK/Ycf46/Vps4 family AAA+-type ATPase